MDFHLKQKQGNARAVEGDLKNTPIHDGFFVLKADNYGDEPLVLTGDIDQSIIQFYFAVEGGALFSFGQSGYQLELTKEKCLLFYNPVLALPLNVEIKPKSKLVFLFISVENLHRLFLDGSDEIAFLNQENIDSKYYTDRAVPPVITLTLNQLFHPPVNGSAVQVFEKAKAYEILAHFFNKEEGTDAEQCPFLNDEENVERIRLAKKILIEKMTSPPTLKELAREIGLNEYRLKEGFKNIYGKTVFQYLNDYRMDTARHLLESGNLKVNDAAYQIGYTNPSHFIAAFRKKFGVTPKKYLTGKIS